MVAVLMGIVVKSSIDIPLTACSALAWRTFGSVGGCVSGSDDFGCVGGGDEQAGVVRMRRTKRRWRKRRGGGEDP